MSLTDVLVLTFLLLVALWLFIRPRKGADRLFLVTASVLYLAAMAGIFWLFDANKNDIPVIGWILLDVIGLALVVAARRLLRSDSHE